MDLACTLINGGKSLSEKYSGNKGPDICIFGGERNKFWVEAICPTKGITKDQVPEFRSNECIQIPSDKIILRITSAIYDKHKIHKNYLKNSICQENEPYIIAINGSLLTPGPGLDDLTPRIIKAVFEGGSNIFEFNPRTGEMSTSWCESRQFLIKYNKENISLGYFYQKEYSNISAVVYSESNYFSRPVELGSDYILVHNPLAKNPLPEGFLKMGVEYMVDTLNKDECLLRMNNYRCHEYLYE